VATRKGVPQRPSTGSRSSAIGSVERAGRHRDPEAEPDPQFNGWCTYFRVGNSNRTFHKVDWAVRSEMQLWLPRKYQCPWGTAEKGWGYLRRRRGNVDAAELEDLGIILTAALTLLALIVGFSFSMAVTRYDQRKTYEVEEANAIGTEYVRASLLHADDAAKMHELLRSYLEQRISFYTARNERQLEQINASTAEFQAHLWAVVQAAVAEQPTPIMALAISGMNDVLNSERYTQAAWWNRIPRPAWWLMLAVAIGCNLLFGYNARQPSEEQTREFLILPLIVSIAFVLIAEMNTPGGGLIRVHPENLEHLFEVPGCAVVMKFSNSRQEKRKSPSFHSATDLPSSAHGGNAQLRRLRP